MAVEGIGGFFFRSADPKALSAWYKEHLGIGGPHGIWNQAAGKTVFQPFKQDTDYFDASKQWMLNLRVSGLADLIASLRKAGIEVTTKPEWDTKETGSFARIHDPEGNAIELWEPPVK